MATGQMTRVLESLRRSGGPRDGTAATDGDLLTAYLERREEPAFEALLKRHGPMVLGVCRRVLGRVHDAEDAFQATFLVLVRRAASIRRREAVANWLYGVAYRTALAARRVRACRAAREREAAAPDRPVLPHEGGDELSAVLDRELNDLPEKYRLPVVLCDLEGRTRREVARQLGIPDGTLSNRLASARRRLAGRLARRGVTLSGGAATAAVSAGAASASVPAALVRATVQSALSVAGGGAAAAAPAQATVLMKGVLRAMWIARLKAAAVVIGVALAAAGVTGLSYPGQASEQAEGRERFQPGQPRPGEQPKPPPALRVVDDGAPPGVRAVNDEGRSPLESRLEKELAELLLQRGSMLQSKGEQHPDVVAIDRRIELIRAMCQQLRRAGSVEGLIQSAEVRKLEAELQTARKELERLNEVVAAARQRFLLARKRLAQAQRKLNPGVPKTETGELCLLDPAARTVRLEMWVDTEEPDAELLGHGIFGMHARVYETFPVAKDATIVQDNLPVRLADVKKGSRLTLTFDAEEKQVVKVQADGGQVRGEYVSRNPSRGTITVLAGAKRERQVCHLVRETEVVGETAQPARLRDLEPGAALLLTRSAEDPNTVIRVEPAGGGR